MGTLRRNRLRFRAQHFFVLAMPVVLTLWHIVYMWTYLL